MELRLAAKQNTKDIKRIEDQTTDRFEQLINQMNAGFNSLENTLKSDINRVEGQTIKWLSLLCSLQSRLLSSAS